MLDQLLNSEHSQVFDIVKNFAGVENQHNDAATSIIKETVVSSLTKQAQSGDLSGIMEMFSGTQSNANSLGASALSNDIVQNLGAKLGLNPQTANSLVQTALPVIMNMFNNKVNSAKSNGIDVASLIGQFMGGQHQNGLDMGSISSLIGMFSGDKQQSQQAQQNNGFGLDDVLDLGKKLF